MDNLDVPELSPYKQLFRSGAMIFVGHTVALRFAGFSYVGNNAASAFGGNITEKNKFFEAVGALPAVTTVTADKLRNAGKDKAFSIINDSVKAGKWMM